MLSIKIAIVLAVFTLATVLSIAEESPEVNENSNGNGTGNVNNANTHDGMGGVADTVVLDRGHEGGHEKEVKEEIEKEKAGELAEEMDHEEEQNMLQLQTDFFDWLKECEEEDIFDCKMSERIRKFMDENHIDEEDIKEKRKGIMNANSKRRKRSYLLAWSGKWDKCIIPYEWDASLRE